MKESFNVSSYKNDLYKVLQTLSTLVMCCSLVVFTSISKMTVSVQLCLGDGPCRISLFLHTKQFEMWASLI